MSKESCKKFVEERNSERKNAGGNVQWEVHSKAQFLTYNPNSAILL